MDALSEVLAEPMLTRFQSEAAKAEETGWFWKYKCNSVKVNPCLLRPCMAASHSICAELNTAAIEFYGSQQRLCSALLGTEMHGCTTWCFFILQVAAATATAEAYT